MGGGGGSLLPHPASPCSVSRRVHGSPPTAVYMADSRSGTDSKALLLLPAVQATEEGRGEHRVQVLVGGKKVGFGESRLEPVHEVGARMGIGIGIGKGMGIGIGIDVGVGNVG